jgi:hypothetical protein
LNRHAAASSSRFVSCNFRPRPPFGVKHNDGVFPGDAKPTMTTPQLGDYGGREAPVKLGRHKNFTTSAITSRSSFEGSPFFTVQLF